ncbi:hypothetical protein, partial [Amphritea sp.]|uniref:hypothetical protein n=1 Tax=Amphritea sp. TaxID=1872502 RepID=UPI003562003F
MPASAAEAENNWLHTNRIKQGNLKRIKGRQNRVTLRKIRFYSTRRRKNAVAAIETTETVIFMFVEQ